MAKLVYRFLESAYKQYIENWCVSRGYKLEDWNPSNGFHGESFVTFAEFCMNEFKDENVMREILSNEDFQFWQTLSNENIQIGTYKLPVTWEVYDTIEIEATSLEEAVKIFEETKNDMELPDDPKYVDDSFQLSTTKVEELKLFNS